MNRIGRLDSITATVCLLAVAAFTPPAMSQMRGATGLAPFAEEAAARGIDYTPSTTVSFGSGLAFVDLDSDGDADIIACGDALGSVGVFENDGSGFFVDRSETSGIAPLPIATGVCAADYDLDGDLDVYLSNGDGPNRLLRNDGSFRFTDVAASACVNDAGHAQGSAWGDYNLDGWPDLYVSNHVLEANRLYLNNGNGKFLEVATALGIEGNEPTLQSAFIDFDLDADLDLYVGNDKGASTNCTWGNYLYENVGDGTFTDETASSGTFACLDTMSISIGDFDGNGWPDMVCTNISPGTGLMLNQGDGTFARAEAEAGVQDEGSAGWGTVFFDFDNDTILDLFVCLQDEENRLYHNSGEWPCVDVASDTGVDTGGRSYVVAAADVDLDGDLDLLVENLNEPLRLFINHEGDDRNWVKFDVIGQGADRFAIGTRLEARTGALSQQRFVQAGANYKSQDELVQHFGMSTTPIIDELIVTWPGGTTRSLINIPVNHTWRIYPLDKCGDSDGDGDRDFDDYLAFAACFTGEDPTHWQPGCELFDYQGDSDVDLDDLDMFLAEYDDVLHDCDNNGVADLRDILAGLAPDADNNGQIDGCVPAVPGDVTGDDMVNLQDLLLVIGNWGSDCPECPEHCNGDANNDCAVNLADLLEVIGNWGL